MDVAKNLPEPQRWNRYAYVTNNPVRYSDPDGRERLQPYHFNRQSAPPVVGPETLRPTSSALVDRQTTVGPVTVRGKIASLETTPFQTSFSLVKGTMEVNGPGTVKGVRYRWTS